MYFNVLNLKIEGRNYMDFSRKIYGDKKIKKP